MNSLKKLGYVDLVESIQKRIEEELQADGKTIPVYDVPPKNQPAPLYYVKVVGKRPNDTKTMFREVFNVWIYCVSSKEQDDRTEVYEMIETVEEAFTKPISLPEGFTLITQSEEGLRNIQKDESGEWDAVLEFSFMIAYGFKCK